MSDVTNSTAVPPPSPDVHTVLSTVKAAHDFANEALATVKADQQAAVRDAMGAVHDAVAQVQATDAKIMSFAVSTGIDLTHHTEGFFARVYAAILRVLAKLHLRVA